MVRNLLWSTFSSPLMCKRMAQMKGRRMFNFRAIFSIVLYGIFICNVPIVGAGMIRRKQFLQDRPYDQESKSDLTGCSEPCTTEVLDLAQRCYPCMSTHPSIHNFVAMARWQLVSDLLIALAYFSIPIELLYFIYRTQVSIWQPQNLGVHHSQRESTCTNERR